MATWPGWQAYFLSAASLPDTANNRQFLTDWANNANHPNCGNNPIDLTHPTPPDSGNCAATGRVGVHVQHYASHLWARTAFAYQIEHGYTHLADALKSGDPSSVSNKGAVATDLGNWSSTKFAGIYVGATPATGGADTDAFKGWTDLQRSFNRRLPAAMDSADRSYRAALRSLAKASRVRI